MSSQNKAIAVVVVVAFNVFVLVVALLCLGRRDPREDFIDRFAPWGIPDTVVLARLHVPEHSGRSTFRPEAWLVHVRRQDGKSRWLAVSRAEYEASQFRCRLHLVP